MNGQAQTRATIISAEIRGWIQLVVVVITAVVATHQLMQLRRSQELTIEMEKRRTALELIRRFNSDHVVQLRGEAVRALAAGGTSEENTHAILAFLNFYNEMALAVLNEQAHEELCRQFFAAMFLFTCKKFEKYVEATETSYPHLRELREQWKQKVKKIEPLTAH